MKRVLGVILVVIALMLIPLSCQQAVPPQYWVVENEIEFLAKCEEANITFDRYDRGEITVYFYQRMIGNITVELDYLNFQFDSDTGQFTNSASHWREDLSETPPAIIISEEQAKRIGNGTEARLYYISPESCIFTFTPTNPCWAVFRYNELGWNTNITVVDATTGEKLGQGEPTS